MAKQGAMFRLTITIVIAAIVILYVIFNTRLLFKGPIIEIYDLYDGQVITDNDLLEIRGKAINISYVTLNGRQIFIDQGQEFRELMLLTNEINPIEIYAEDKFKKTTTKKITLVYRKSEENKEYEIIDRDIFIESTSTEILEMEENTTEEPEI